MHEDESKKSRGRSRKMIYFLPPYSRNVTTNVGAKFLGLLQKCFPKGHVLAKAFNKNSIKMTYCTMPNVKSKISSHNKNILNR